MASIHRALCVQTDPAYGEVERNLDEAERLLGGAGGAGAADLVVLPELFSTGYSFRDRAEATALGERFPEGPTCRRLLAWSARLRAAVVAGFVERDGSRLYNAAATFADGRPVACYRKIHLFGFERDVFDPGDRPFGVVEHRGLRIGTMVCFDWRFPEAARSLALLGADVIAHPSNLVLPWCQRAMAIRSLENGVYAVTANRVGSEERAPRPALRFTGASQVTAPDGSVLASAPETGAAVVRAEIDVARARDKRIASGNDPFAERRPAFYVLQSPSAAKPPSHGETGAPVDARFMMSEATLRCPGEERSDT